MKFVQMIYSKYQKLEIDNIQKIADAVQKGL